MANVDVSAPDDLRLFFESIVEGNEEEREQGGKTFKDIYVYCNFPENELKKVIEIGNEYHNHFMLTFTVQTKDQSGRFEILEYR